MPAARVVMLGTLAIAAAYVAWHLRRGWMPFDDGAMAQSAERLLQGQLPHRDFDDVYTGGLSYLNAAAFRMFGTNLWAMRIVLFAVFLAWVPAVFAIASRFVRPYAAGAVTLLAVAWSLPNYSAAMPSWYNLFLATFGVAALFRNMEDGRVRWLVLAGVVGGLSVLVKVVGLYYVAGVLLYLVFRAHSVAREQAVDDARAGSGYAAFVTGALLAFVAALAVLVRRQFHAPELAQFVLPGVLLAALLIRNEWVLPAGGSRARFAILARLLAPFLAGVALPVAIFLAPYARSGAVGALANGVFVLPMKRFGFAVTRVIPLWTMLASIPLVALAFLARRRLTPRWALALLGFALVATFIVTGRNGATYRTVWYGVENLLPLLAVAGVAVLWRERPVDVEQPLLRPRLMALLCVMALCNLVQFPYFVANYLCYVAPLILLTAVALSVHLRLTSGAVPAMAMAFYLAFAVGRTNRTTLYTMAVEYRPYLPTRMLRLPRGGIEVPTYHADAYEQLIPLLRARARGGYTWASPDLPEVYFLSGLKNPTRSLFDFFDDTTGRATRILQTLESHGVTAIVLNRRGAFSPLPSDALIDALEQRYPYATNVGPFHVRWRQ
jgi:hypothetical protein